MKIDPRARTYHLHPSLIIPIGAKSKEALATYVGDLETCAPNDRAFLTSFAPLAAPNDLEVWNHARSPLFHQNPQLWVHVDYRNYRKVYQRAFPKALAETNSVVDHLMNRKLARSLGYSYVRLLHISRSANSSAGRGGETYANQNLPISQRLNADINASDLVYADPMDLLKMLNIPVGGFGLEAVGERHHWLYGK